LQAFFQSLFRQQAGRHHHAGVGSVGARGNRGDDHSAVAQGVVLAFMAVGDFAGLIGVADRHTATPFTLQAPDLFGQRFGLQLDEVVEGLAYLSQGNPVLWPLGPGQAGLDVMHVQGQCVAEQRFLPWQAPQALCLAILLDQFHGFAWAAGQPQVVESDLIDREEATGRAVLRCHVGDGRTVGQRQVGQAVAVELDEFADDAFLAQHLRDGQYQVGGGDAFAQLAGELEADHFRYQHRHRLAEHGRFRLDAADAPAEYAKAVDHGGVRVGADQRVGEGIGAAIVVAGPYRAPEVFQVDLVADASARRYHAEVVECTLAPAQEGITFAVALHFDVDVLGEGLWRGVAVDHHRVVDHQVHRRQRVDPLRITAGLGHGGAHGGQVDDCWHTREVLHQHPRRAVLDFAVGATFLQPAGEGAQVIGADGLAVFPAQQVFQQYLERHGQALQVAQLPAGFGEAVVVVGAVSHLEGLEGIHAIERGHCQLLVRRGPGTAGWPVPPRCFGPHGTGQAEGSG